MINSGWSLISILGLLDLVVAIGYIVLTIGNIVDGWRSISTPTLSLLLVLRLCELLVCPASLFLSGVILLFRGWRLDPILQLQQLLLHLIVSVAIAKNIRKLTQPPH